MLNIIQLYKSIIEPIGVLDTVSPKQVSCEKDLTELSLIRTMPLYYLQNKFSQRDISFF
jgi:hypothetical protein